MTRESSTSEDADDRPAQIRRSRMRAAQGAAVQVIQTLLSLEVKSSEFIPSLPPVPLKVQQKFLLALIETLPTGMDDSHSSTPPNSSTSLDDGSSLYGQVLVTLQLLLLQKHLRLEFLALARLLDSCTACLHRPKLVDAAAETLKQCLEQMTENNLEAAEPVIWKRMFPGIFLALYRCLMQNHKKSSLVDVDCLVALRLLFQSTLPEQATLISAQSMVARLQKLCLKGDTVDNVQKESSNTSSETGKDASNSMHRASSSSNSSQEDEEEFFLQQLNQRTVGLLTVLLTQCRGSKYEQVRLETANLCRLLLERQHCWKDASEIPRLALESCLLLQGDKEAAVVQVAKSVTDGLQALESYSTDWMIPNMLAHIKALPDVFQGQRDAQVQSHLLLLKGYVGICPPSALLHHRQDVLTSLAASMDLDFEILSLETPTIRIVGTAPVLPYRYLLSMESRELAQQLLRTIGGVLGMKRSAVLVDSCIATAYESALEQREKNSNQESMDGRGHAEWAHGIVGHLVVAVEVRESSIELMHTIAIGT